MNDVNIVTTRSRINMAEVYNDYFKNGLSMRDIAKKNKTSEQYIQMLMEQKHWKRRTIHQAMKAMWKRIKARRLLKLKEGEIKDLKDERKTKESALQKEVH